MSSDAPRQNRCNAPEPFARPGCLPVKDGGARAASATVKYSGPMQRLMDKTILVTGGTFGIGRANASA
jgi:hypothetical protein